MWPGQTAGRDMTRRSSRQSVSRQYRSVASSASAGAAPAQSSVATLRILDLDDPDGFDLRNVRPRDDIGRRVRQLLGDLGSLR